MSCACEDGRACPACSAQDEWDYQVLAEPSGHELEVEARDERNSRTARDEDK